MAESSDVNHVAKFLTYIARFDNRHERIAQAEAEHAPERVVQWLKTASPSVASSSLSIFAQAMDRFLGSNAPRSAFASMRRDMMQVPCSRASCSALELSRPRRSARDRRSP